MDRARQRLLAQVRRDRTARGRCRVVHRRGEARGPWHRYGNRPEADRAHPSQLPQWPGHRSSLFAGIWVPPSMTASSRSWTPISDCSLRNQEAAGWVSPGFTGQETGEEQHQPGAGRCARHHPAIPRATGHHPHRRTNALSAGRSPVRSKCPHAEHRRRPCRRATRQYAIALAMQLIDEGTFHIRSGRRSRWRELRKRTARRVWHSPRQARPHPGLIIRTMPPCSRAWRSTLESRDRPFPVMATMTPGWSTFSCRQLISFQLPLTPHRAQTSQQA